MRKGVVGICLLLAGLVSIQSPAPAFASEEGFYLQVPFVQQVENYCGPAALAMVLRYWDQEADQSWPATSSTFPTEGSAVRS